ncbi:MAG TPA: triose-phosphate isomerase, partial [Candidatus Omnitrophica bacterium]|nr:triose-phosphate isomerase [Candidatus Omnitrophota bacterium]
MRDIIFIGNWKMNKTIAESLSLVNGLERELIDVEGCRIIVAPPYTALNCVNDAITDTNIELSAQNICWEKSGAFTGETSSVMVKDSGCDYVIIGHSERRQYFKEQEDVLNKKIVLALDCGLKAIYCIGETLSERETAKTMDVIKTQLLGGLENIPEDKFANIIIAYEPVWAIGTGRNATPSQAQEVHMFIRENIAKLYSQEAADNTSILYGGSVKPDNIEDLMKEPDIDGVL